MPLTEFQCGIARLLASGRTEDSYLAGGSALHMTPQSIRYSNDLDYFHDSVERVASSFATDHQALHSAGYAIHIEMKQPGYIRALVSNENDQTKIEWSHDSAWRFMPTLRDKLAGFCLHPVDLAINKLLALAGRDEPRDFLDILYVHSEILSLGALCWAGAGKDPGFTPRSLLELVRRRGKYQPEDFSRLHLTKPVDLIELKGSWLSAVDDAELFVSSRPPSESGCLYYSLKEKKFVAPKTIVQPSIVPHYGRPGGVLPQFC